MLEIVEYGKDEYAFPSLLVLGCFDAIHAGHRELFKKARLQAKINGLDLGVMMFRDGKGGKLVYSFEERVAMLSAYGVKFVLVIDYTPEFKNTMPLDFLSTIEEKINVKAYMSGKDFKFGKGAKGKSSTLKNYAEDEENGVWYMPLKDVLYEGEKISTTLIKSCLAEGDVKKAGVLLGEKFFVEGVVVEGAHRGTGILGFPTVNIEYPDWKYPVKHGVYKVIVTIEGKEYSGIANFGGRPTFDDDKEVLEVHIKDFEGDVYGSAVKVSFVGFMREIHKFADASALAAQLEQDKCALDLSEEQFFAKYPLKEEQPAAEEAAEAIEEPAVEETAEVAEQPAVEETVEVTEEPAVEESAEAIEETIEVTEEPAVEESVEVAEEPAVEETAEAVEEPAAEEAAEVTEEPAIEETVEAVEEPAVEETVEVTEEPAIEETVEVTEEPAVEETEEIVENIEAIDPEVALFDEPAEAIANDEEVAPAAEIVENVPAVSEEITPAWQLLSEPAPADQVAETSSEGEEKACDDVEEPAEAEVEEPAEAEAEEPAEAEAEEPAEAEAEEPAEAEIEEPAEEAGDATCKCGEDTPSGETEEDAQSEEAEGVCEETVCTEESAEEENNSEEQEKENND